jgi:hypothetical protein
MAEQTFRSPGFFEQEIDISGRIQTPVGVPAGVIGVAQKGPAFVPVTVGSLADFQTKFGSLDPNMFGPYAVNEWLKNRSALTYVRVLGAGANTTSADIANTANFGIVKNAGFKVLGASTTSNGTTVARGAVQFITAKHTVLSDEAQGYPTFTFNSSTPNSSTANLVRGMVLLATGTRMLTLDYDKTFSILSLQVGGTFAKVGSLPNSSAQEKYFKLVLSSTAPTYGTAEGFTGIRILTASLDPNDGSYIGKILNTDPLRFESEQHLLYADFSVENDLAKPAGNDTTVALVSGSSITGFNSVTFQDLFGRFDTRYTTAKTTSFISQPFGRKEYDLFNFETIDDGAAGNESYKISIANLRASTDPNYPYGTFEIQVRAFGDTDVNPQILEAYPNCNLDPQSLRYVARVIGDKKVYYDFDQTVSSERRLIISGKYPNVSPRVRIRMNDDVENKSVPSDALPFGFRGIPTLKTSDTLTDVHTIPLVSKTGITLGDASSRRLTTSGTAENYVLTGSIIPPLPMTFKVTRGISSKTGFIGYPGTNEQVDARFYWGVKNTRLVVSTSTDPVLGFADSLYRTNEGSDYNTLISAYTKFLGIQGLDSLITGSAADEFNDNKFTLAKVATSQTGNGLAGVFNSSVFTGSAEQVMLESAYIRNGFPRTTDYAISGTGPNTYRYTLASLIATSSVLFNRFTSYAKFTNIFYGGFDGLNILNRDQFYFRDRAFSSDAGGRAVNADPNIGLQSPGGTTPNPFGAGRLNNNVASVNAATRIITDPFLTEINLLAIPGVRDSFVTDEALALSKNNGLIMYVMDLVKYDSSGNRLYDDSAARPDPGRVAEQFNSRAVDNNYGATFFPDVNIEDTVNNFRVKVPASIAAVGALGYNDKVAFPWFAPAGFNRGALSFVSNVETRLSQDDRDTLYDARINPIAVFPTGGFVVFGQKTLQQARSALDRINVRRLLLEVKRVVGSTAQNLLFEPNNAQTRARFIAGITPQLALIQSQQGLDSFKVVCDGSNNSDADVEASKLNGKIIIVPTRTVEFIAIDFIVTNSGVQFV